MVKIKRLEQERNIKRVEPIKEQPKKRVNLLGQPREKKEMIFLGRI